MRSSVSLCVCRKQLQTEVKNRQAALQVDGGLQDYLAKLQTHIQVVEGQSNKLREKGFVTLADRLKSWHKVMCEEESMIKSHIATA